FGGVAAGALRDGLAAPLAAGTVRMGRRRHDRRVDHARADPRREVDDLPHALAHLDALARVGNRSAAAHADGRDTGVAQFAAKVPGGLLGRRDRQRAAGRDLDAVEAGFLDVLQVLLAVLARRHLAEGVALARVVDAASQRVAELHSPDSFNGLR